MEEHIQCLPYVIPFGNKALTPRSIYFECVFTPQYIFDSSPHTQTAEQYYFSNKRRVLGDTYAPKINKQKFLATSGLSWDDVFIIHDK